MARKNAPVRGRGALPIERRPTLLDLVAAVNEFAASEQETVRVVMGLLESGRVRLAGGFREQHLRALQAVRERLAS